MERMRVVVRSVRTNNGKVQGVVTATSDRRCGNAPEVCIILKVQISQDCEETRAGNRRRVLDTALAYLDVE